MILDGTSTNSDPHPLTTQNQYVQHILTGPSFIFPLGGEYVNGTVIIQWTSTYDTLGHDLYYNVSYRQGIGSWISIGVELTATQVNWITTESLDGSEYQIQVISYCNESLEIESRSGLFSVRHHSLTSPSFISQLEDATINDIFVIEWDAAEDDFPSHLVQYDVFYRHNFSVWIPIAEAISETSVNWDTTTTHDGSGYQIRIIAYCNHGLDKEIISGFFTIGQESVPKFPWLYIIAGIGAAAIVGLSISLGVVSTKLKKVRTGKELKPAAKPKVKQLPQSKPKQAVNPDIKPEVKPDTKPESKTDLETKSESKS